MGGKGAPSSAFSEPPQSGQSYAVSTMYRGPAALLGAMEPPPMFPSCDLIIQIVPNTRLLSLRVTACKTMRNSLDWRHAETLRLVGTDSG